MNKKILLNRRLLIAGVGTCILYAMICWMFVALTSTGILRTKTEADKQSVILFFACLSVACIGCIFLALPRWSAYIRCRDDGIEWHTAFKKSTIVPYNCYHYFYVAYYIHATVSKKIGSCVYFIVMSQRPLSQWELTHINKIAPSVSVIKMRMNAHTLTSLEKALPKKQRRKLLLAIQKFSLKSDQNNS